MTSTKVTLSALALSGVLVALGSAPDALAPFAVRGTDAPLRVGTIGSAALHAGENPTQALGSAAELAEQPVRAELRELSRRLAAGVGIGEAVEPLVRGYDSEGVRLFSQTLIVKWRSGGKRIRDFVHG